MKNDARPTIREWLICAGIASVPPVAAGICVYLFNLHPAVIIGAMIFGGGIGASLSKSMASKRMARADARR